ncbi:MAG: hypothetical protein IT405_03085 [Candidatus Yanofskybacteria bacterium]|nr:hypothetical protein [Candidatus Yanofskybacteria bacterium]
MLKAIFAKHVRAGDSVLISGGARAEVEWVELCGTEVTLKTTDGRKLRLKEYDIVGLGRRPLPEWRTADECRKRIELLARTTMSIGALSQAEFNNHIEHLRTAIDEYELGKGM